VTGPAFRPGGGGLVTVPLRYVTVAAGAFVLAASAVPWLAPELGGHYYQPRLLALTHMIALGFVTLAIMGASYQIVPVVLERPIWSARLARWQLGLFGAGTAGMVAHFHLAAWSGLGWAAGLTALGIGAHLLNMGLSLRALPRWSFTARLFAAGTAGLGMTALAGIGLVGARMGLYALADPLGLVGAHFHLALLGWVLPTLLGVAARLYPMFLLAPAPQPRLARVQLWGLLLGVPAVVLGLAAWPRLVLPGALLVAVGVAAHSAAVAAMLATRKRPALDWGLRAAIAGTACLGLAALAGLALAEGRLAGPRATLAYAVLALGSVSLTIAGMLLKIVPFLVWQRVYAPRIGRAPVPTLAELGWPRAQAFGSVGLLAGTLGLAAAVAAGDAAWIRGAGALLGPGALAFGGALGGVLSHLSGPAGPGAPAPARAGA
jgi:hypothetical protein